MHLFPPERSFKQTPSKRKQLMFWRNMFFSMHGLILWCSPPITSLRFWSDFCPILVRFWYIMKIVINYWHTWPFRDYFGTPQSSSVKYKVEMTYANNPWQINTIEKRNRLYVIINWYRLHNLFSFWNSLHFNFMDVKIHYLNHILSILKRFFISFFSSAFMNFYILFVRSYTF